MNPQPDQSDSRGMPLWFTLAALLVLAVISIGVLAFVLRRSADDKARLERQVQAWELEKGKAEIDRQKAAEQAKLALARTRQTEALSLVRVATNACGQLLADIREVQTEAAALRTSDAGRQVAKFPDLVVLAKRFYEAELRQLTPLDLAISKLEGERRLESQLVSASGTVFEPEVSLLATARADANWATLESSKVQRLHSVLGSLVEESKIKIPLADSAATSLTLEAAMLSLSRKEAANRQRLVTEKTGVATATGNQTVASAEADKILTEAKLQAARILEKANDQAAKQQQEQLVRDAERKVAANDAADAASKVQLRAKAKDPKIQAKLAAFTTPGYVQFGPDSYEKAPLSYSGLVQYGALSTSKSGLQKLANIARTREDKIRPRWRFHFDQNNGWEKTTEDREMVMEAQQLLIELGPTLVEMGLLQK